MPIKRVASGRESRVSRDSHATAGSIMPNPVVIAARLSITKNRVPSTTPPGMPAKATGRVSKIRPGPLLASRPTAKTIGKIAIPASRATIESAPAMIAPARGSETRCGT